MMNRITDIVCNHLFYLEFISIKKYFLVGIKFNIYIIFLRTILVSELVPLVQGKPF